ncbi:MAG TPA: hypothetical protein VFL30_08265 [Rhodanobacteraceae bacterium]|nr:hypothetical protein [Rhodanobacteraceae bacterium]
MKIIAALAFCVALSAGFAGTAAAKEHYRENSVKADNKEAFDQLADNVRREMGPGGKYEFIKPDEKPKVDKALDDMTKLFEQHDTVEAMTQDQKVALFNAQETVNSILTLRNRDRVICQNKPPLGSHIPQTSCHTYEQEVQAREGAKKMMDDWGRPLCVGKNMACGNNEGGGGGKAGGGN